MAPIEKLVYNTNFLLFQLQEVFITQWGPPLDVDGDGSAKWRDRIPLRWVAMRTSIAGALLSSENAKLHDKFPFVGYHQLTVRSPPSTTVHQYPPPGRPSRTVAGIQFFEVPLSCGVTLQLALMSHTTRVSILLKDGSWANYPNHTTRSPTGELAIPLVHLQVMLSYFVLVNL
ncbi:hypothetical protein T492DRAFT_1045659 [Pavlovales sp. CCMP2436]|nr:hypothetical protein T492DRAFT_1045659 [Pavlovales sp. CCMP2436]